MATRNDNLRKARTKRIKIGHLFDQLKSGELDLCETIKEPPVELLNTDLYDVLRRGKGFRKAKAKHVCLQAQVWPHDTLAQLSIVERGRIIDCITKLQSS